MLPIFQLDPKKENRLKGVSVSGIIFLLFPALEIQVQSYKKGWHSEIEAVFA